MGKKVKWGEWAKLGFVLGLFWGVIFFLGGMLIGTALGGVQGLFTGALIGGLVGIAVVIGLTISGAIQSVLGRAVTEVIGWQSKKEYWKLVQVWFSGSLVLTLISVLYSHFVLGEAIVLLSLGISVVIGFVGSLISGKVLEWMYKQLHWKIPQE